ncbi:hypothetical protein PRIC2_006866 [Phytophthora ramorum]
MKIVQVGAFAATLTTLSTLTHGYSFSDAMNDQKEESTDLTTNEESRIYGGTEANIDKYPFLVSLRDPFFDETFCAGALIAPQYILTAGHCIKTDEMDIVATFGTNDSTGSGSGDAKQFPVIQGFRHPMYKKKEHLYDVGLLKLKTPVKRKTAKLCAVDGSDNEVGTMATVLGWGKTEDSSGAASPILEQLTIPVISNAQCGKFEKYVGRVTEGMLCAGTGNGKDTCNGDSGGPLLVDDDILIGCVSWGSKCGEQAGIYTRLTYVMDYIEDILGGGDGSKFNVTSSSDSSMEDVSSSDGSNSDATMNPVKATKAPKEEGPSESASGSSSIVDLFDGLSSSSLDAMLEWLFNSASGSAEEETKAPTTKTTKTTKASKKTSSESTTGSSSEALLGSSFESSLGSQSESASDSSEAPATKVTKATKGSTQTTEFASSSSEEESTKSPVATTSKVTKATKSTKTVEDSASASSESDLVHQSDVVQQESQ